MHITTRSAGGVNCGGNDRASGSGSCELANADAAFIPRPQPRCAVASAGTRSKDGIVRRFGGGAFAAAQSRRVGASEDWVVADTYLRWRPVITRRGSRGLYSVLATLPFARSNRRVRVRSCADGARC